MADEQVQAVGDQMPRVRVLLQQAVARYVLRTGHPAWVLMPEHFKGGPRVSLRFIEETRPDFGEQVLVGHGVDEETAARDLIAKLGYTVDSSPEKVAAVRERFGMGPERATVYPGDTCGSPGRDVVCHCGHRAWLHVGDKEDCKSLGSGVACQCAAFRPQDTEHTCRPHLVPEVPKPTCVEHGLVIRRDGTCGNGCRGLG